MGNQEDHRQLRNASNKAPRAFSYDIDSVLLHYGRQVHVVQLWRRRDRTRHWVYLDRLRPDEYGELSFLQATKEIFGGGEYKARIYGPWLRDQRREQYLEQVVFRIAGAPTSLTNEIMSQVRES